MRVLEARPYQGCDLPVLWIDLEDSAAMGLPLSLEPLSRHQHVPLWIDHQTLQVLESAGNSADTTVGIDPEDRPGMVVFV